MSRFGFLLAAGISLGWVGIGCGEKDLSSNPNSQGGSPDSGGAAATGGAQATPESDAGLSGSSDVAMGPVYSNDIELFLKKYCAMCHGAGGDSPQLDTYPTAKAAAVRSNDSIQAGRMPPSAKPTTAEKARFADWVKAGSPQ